MWRIIPAGLAALLLAAHFLRAGDIALVVTTLAAPLFLLRRRRWILRGLQGLLCIAAITWCNTALRLIEWRQSFDQPWTRLAIILGALSLFTLFAALLLNSRKMLERYSDQSGTSTAPTLAFFLTAILLAIVQLKVRPPLLLPERFVAGAGWPLILLLSFYAGLVCDKMLDINQQPLVRQRIWRLFSLLFFLQLAIGLLGYERFLMSGELHLPVPAMIIAGPIYRGQGLFMIALLVISLLLVGPAWCSHLCYIGAWDDIAAKKKRRPAPLAGWRDPLRIAILSLVILSALALRALGTPAPIAAIFGLAFGLLGVATMLIWSRRKGAMVHCTAYCPIGLVADWLGRLSPFRLKINQTCTKCGACSLACRYDALATADIERKKAGISCTLCGDCLSACNEGSIEYRFLRLNPQTARQLFIIMIVSFHAACIAVARI